MSTDAGQSPFDDPLRYAGVKRLLVARLDAPRDPRPTDYKYPILCEWRNSNTNDVWKLIGWTSGLGIWVLLTGGSGNLIEFVANVGTSQPVAGIENILGNAVAAHSVPIQTVASGNTVNINTQYSSAAATSISTNAGLCSFLSTQFSVDANGFVSINNFSPFNYVQINNASSPYTATSTDYYISCDPTAGAITVKLPNAPTNFRMFTIKDRTGQASINNISITTVGGVVTIDGATTYTLAGNHGSVNLIFNNTGTYEVY